MTSIKQIEANGRDNEQVHGRNVCNSTYHFNVSVDFSTPEN